MKFTLLLCSTALLPLTPASCGEGDTQSFPPPPQALPPATQVTKAVHLVTKSLASQHTNRASEISQPQAPNRSHPYRASGLVLWPDTCRLGSAKSTFVGQSVRTN